MLRLPTLAQLALLQGDISRTKTVSDPTGNPYMTARAQGLARRCKKVRYAVIFVIDLLGTR